MKKAMRLGAFAMLLVGGVAYAGDCSGFSCQNMCPLAKAAGEHRSFGKETPAKAALAAQVQKSLAKV
jgi:hypothetical protein